MKTALPSSNRDLQRPPQSGASGQAGLRNGAVAHSSASRNRTNAAWLRARLGRLHDEILRREVYEQPPLSSAEIRRELTRIQRGEP